MNECFRFSRRQAFLTEVFLDAADANYTFLLNSIEVEIAHARSRELVSLHHATRSRLRFEQFVLRFTAGRSIPSLRAELPRVIEAFEHYVQALAMQEGVPCMAPLGFDDLHEYERALQLVSLCYLLHRRDLLPRLRGLLDPAYAGEDTVYEDLMSFDVAGRADVDQWYHAEPYTALVNAMYLERPGANAALKNYCVSWYACFERAPWHGSHTRIEGTEGDYFGYWAFEAGAVALLYDLDDSAIDDMVYPRDLVAWARKNRILSEGM
ncbi:PoNe immunity protein domain-containing protein [Pseudorhodoferax sp.]|uniref:PoNe immunity protein domain-containing protein n=1 Tax=Pseudorhodoferax sp. TaxID=1993553 RepID=UPI0039E4B7CF